MAFAPIALMAGSAIVGAVGSIAAGQARANAANYSAQVARNNSTIMKQNSDYALASGNAQVESVSRKNAVRLGQIKAAQAASGVDVNTGSAADVQESQREIGKLDAETTANNASLEAYGYRAKAMNYDATSDLKDAEADSARVGSYFDTAGGLLASASGIAGKWGGGANPNTSGNMTPTENYNSGNPVY